MNWRNLLDAVQALAYTAGIVGMIIVVLLAYGTNVRMQQEHVRMQKEHVYIQKTQEHLQQEHERIMLITERTLREVLNR